jgi:hypothetical protein
MEGMAWQHAKWQACIKRDASSSKERRRYRAKLAELEFYLISTISSSIKKTLEWNQNHILTFLKIM